MQLPEDIQAAVDKLYTRHVDLARGSDEDRRALTLKMAQQARFLRGRDWGTKRADAARPQSKDAIAFRGGSELIAWDWQNGATREPQWWRNGAAVPLGSASIPSIPIPGQVFIEVEPVDHLNVPPRPDTLPPAVDPAEVQLLRQKVNALERDLAELRNLLRRPVALKARANGRYLSADRNLGDDVPVVANRDAIGSWETFDVERLP